MMIITHVPQLWIGFKTSVKYPKKIGKGASKSKKSGRRRSLRDNEKKKTSDADEKIERASKTNSRKSIQSFRSEASRQKSHLSLFTEQSPCPEISLYDSRKTFETSESEPLPSEGSSEESSTTDEKADDGHDSKENNRQTDNKTDDFSEKKEPTEEHISGEEIENTEVNILKQTKNYEECNECNGKIVNAALSQENIQLLRTMRCKEKKLRETRRQLNEERSFYEHQKMELCRSISKKKSKHQIIQTEETGFEFSNKINNLETQMENLREDLDKEVKKNMRLKEKCTILKRKNGELKNEININEEDYEKSWKEVHEKMEKYKKEYGTIEKSSGVIKNVYDQVLKKNAYLARSNFALQAELRRLYRKFERISYSQPTITKISYNSELSTKCTTSSPDLRTGSQKRKRRPQRLVRRSSTDCSSGNLVVSGSLISIHVKGAENRLRPVFLVLDEAKRTGTSRLKQRYNSVQKKSESLWQNFKTTFYKKDSSEERKKREDEEYKKQEPDNISNKLEDEVSILLETKEKTAQSEEAISMNKLKIRETRSTDSESCIIECNKESSSVQ